MSEKLISKFRNRSGYIIEEFKVNDEKWGEYIRLKVTWKKDNRYKYLGIVTSGWEVDFVIEACIEDFSKIITNIKDKIARRYFLRKFRELPMHEYKIKDFMRNSKDLISWKKVYEYEKEHFPEEDWSWLNLYKDKIN